MSECVIDEIHRLTDPEPGTRWISRLASPFPPKTQGIVFVFVIIDENVYYKYEADMQTEGLDAPTCACSINQFLAGFCRYRLRKK